MSAPYIGEIRMGAWDFAPRGWAFCHGQQLPIAEFQNVFGVIGITYGGDGTTYFNLPDLRGRIAIHPGEGHVRGQAGGTETVTLEIDHMPSHGHPLMASSDSGVSPDPAGHVLARPATAGAFLYIEDLPDTPMAAQCVVPDGESQPHTNLAPYQCISYIFALSGVVPEAG